MQALFRFFYFFACQCFFEFSSFNHHVLLFIILWYTFSCFTFLRSCVRYNCNVYDDDDDENKHCSFSPLDSFFMRIVLKIYNVRWVFIIICWRIVCISSRKFNHLQFWRLFTIAFISKRSNIFSDGKNDWSSFNLNVICSSLIGAQNPVRVKSKRNNPFKNRFQSHSICTRWIIFSTFFRNSISWVWNSITTSVDSKAVITIKCHSLKNSKWTQCCIDVP